MAGWLTFPRFVDGGGFDEEIPRTRITGRFG
jgi:hypothetical protein